MHLQANKYPMINGVPKRFELRWYFIYGDTKPDRWGAWSALGDQFARASLAPKEHLRRVIIQGKDIFTNKIISLIDLPGSEFANFEWVGAAACNLAAKAMTIRPNIVGAQIHTNDHVYRVMISGVISKRERTESEKSIHFSTYGR